MRTLLLLALALVPVSALRMAKVDGQRKPKTTRACEVPAGFVRKVNPKSHRQPTEEELSQPGFFDKPHIEKIFYINLDKSLNRKESIERNIDSAFPGVKYERWPATKKFQVGKIMKANISSFTNIGNQVGAGSQATYLSHHFLLQHIAMQTDPNAVFIIMEDDILLDRTGLMHSVECQLNMLPPEWDIFKFGYWGFRMEGHTKKWGYPHCDGEQINDNTCHQEHFNWNYMGNQAYAVRPKGAANLIEHLKNIPVMDIDGAMMPGINWGKKYDKPLWPNTYVSKYNMVGHGSFASLRLKTAVAEEALDDVDEKTNKLLVQEAEDLANDEDGRETSAEAFERIEKGQSPFWNLAEDQFE